jgi:hypothetical protein
VQKLPDGSVQMELADLICMNRLIRETIDLAGFQDWYACLAPGEQVVLLSELHLCAQQAGAREDTFDAAVETARMSKDHPLIMALSGFRGGIYRGEDPPNGLRGETEWLASLHSDERLLLLPVLVHCFGIAEGRVYAAEVAESCNHWWHRDLLDDRVVNDLLDDPRYQWTAMRDDERVKATLRE